MSEDRTTIVAFTPTEARMVADALMNTSDWISAMDPRATVAEDYAHLADRITGAIPASEVTP